MRLFFNGGLNEQQTPHLYECSAGYNFELGLRQSKLVPRKPFDLKGTAPNGAASNGFLQLVKRSNAETTLVQCGDTVYLWDGASSFTSKGTVSASSRLRDTYWSLGDYLVITDTTKSTVVKKWDGTTFGNLTTGLGGTSLFAKYGAVHLNRVWLANVTAGTDTPHMIVASELDDPESYDTSVRGGPTAEGGSSFSVGTEAFYLLSPDLKPINGMVSFFGNLIISTEGGKLYRLQGTSASTFKFVDYYPGSSAIGESLANIGNDVIWMKPGGGIDLLSATQTSGDVSADDLSRWIPTTVKDLTDALTIYDQKNQKVLFFVDDKILVLYKDLIGGEMSPWSVYKTQQSFAFNTNAAKYMKRPGTQIYSVYFGDSIGRIFDLNGTGTGDAGASSIAVLRKTRYIYDGEGGDARGRGAIDLMRRVLDGVIQYRRLLNSVDVTLSFDWGDEYNVSSSSITLKGSPTGSGGVYYGGGSYYSGSAYYSQGLAFRDKISSQTFSPTGKGPGFFLSVSADTDDDFQIDSLDLQPN